VKPSLWCVQFVRRCGEVVFLVCTIVRRCGEVVFLVCTIVRRCGEVVFVVFGIVKMSINCFRKEVSDGVFDKIAEIRSEATEALTRIAQRSGANTG